MNIIEHIAKTRLPLGEEGRQLFIPKVCLTCKFFTNHNALLCSVNPTACKDEDSYCPQWETRRDDDIWVPLEEVISVFPLEPFDLAQGKPTGYRIIWYGKTDDEIFWDYRTFATMSDAISGGVEALQDYWRDGIIDAYQILHLPEPLARNTCDEIYQGWLICTNLEDYIELIDPKTNQVHSFSWRDEHTFALDIDYYKDWIDQLECDRSVPEGQLSLFD